MAHDTRVTTVIGSDIDQKTQKSFVADTRDPLLGSLEKNGVLKTVCFDVKHMYSGSEGWKFAYRDSSDRKENQSNNGYSAHCNTIISDSLCPR